MEYLTNVIRNRGCGLGAKSRRCDRGGAAADPGILHGAEGRRAGRDGGRGGHPGDRCSLGRAGRGPSTSEREARTLHHGIDWG